MRPGPYQHILPGGTPSMLRSLIGLTGIALLSAAVFGSGMAWVMPGAYLLATLYALESAWTTPWIWPGLTAGTTSAQGFAQLLFSPREP